MLDLVDLLAAPARQAAALEVAAHRPWPLPERPWLLAQTLDDVLFLHRRADPDALRELLPDGLELDLHDGAAWVGVTAFAASATRLRGTPPVPGLSSYREVNVRTYVAAGERPGILFLSLDLSSTPAVEAARRFFHVPAHRARVEVGRQGGSLLVESARAGAAEPTVLTARARPSRSAAAPARAGSLESFLVERYCLYAVRDGALARAEVHHAPWSLRRAEPAVELDTLLPDGLRLEGDPLCHVGEPLDVLLWPLSEA